MGTGSSRRNIVVYEDDVEDDVEEVEEPKPRYQTVRLGAGRNPRLQAGGSRRNFAKEDQFEEPNKSRFRSVRQDVGWKPRQQTYGGRPNYQSEEPRLAGRPIAIDGVDAKISYTDMDDDEMLEAAMVLAQEAFDSFNIDEDRAIHLKSNFQKMFGTGPWHCVVGSLFGTRVTHDKGYFVNIQIRDKSFVLWKCGSS